MTVFRTSGAAALAAVALMLGACSNESGEPRGLESGPPTTTAEPEDPTSAPEPTEPGEAEPAPAFTQPFVPGEGTVIELPEALPVEGDDDLSAEEEAVVDALGHAMASWDAILFGADPVAADLQAWFSGDLLGSLTQYSVESMAQQRVSVGSATRIALLEVTVDAGEAEVVACFYTPDWVMYVGGQPGDEVEPLERYAMSGISSDGAWTFHRSEDLDGENQCP